MNTNHLLAASLLLLCACSRDRDPVTGTGPGCLLAKTWSGVTGAGFSDSATFSHRDGKVVEASNKRGVYFYSWSGDRLQQKRFESHTASDPREEETYSYNSAGGLTLQERYRVPAGGGTRLRIDSVVFTYTGSQLSGLRRYRRFDPAAPLVLSKEYTYSYTGGNITSFIETEHSGGSVATRPWSLQYDSEPNLLRKTHPQLFAVNPLMDGIDLQYIPFLVSSNNVLSTTIFGNPGSTVLHTWGSSASGNLETWTVSNAIQLKFGMICP